MLFWEENKGIPARKLLFSESSNVWSVWMERREQNQGRLYRVRQMDKNDSRKNNAQKEMGLDIFLK